MPDMLVNLLKLPPLAPEIDRLAALGVVVRRAQTFEQSAVRAFVEREFTVGWADEISAGYANKPVTVYIATRDRRVVGFAAYESTRRAFFGPTGVSPSERKIGIGRALLIASLHGLAELGYVYGFIGGVGPAEFYAKAVGAVVVEGSVPGIYTDLLRKPGT